MFIAERQLQQTLASSPLASSPSRGRALTGLKKLVIERSLARSLVMIAGEESKGRLRMRETGTCNVLARMHAWASGAVGSNFFLWPK